MKFNVRSLLRSGLLGAIASITFLSYCLKTWAASPNTEPRSPTTSASESGKSESAIGLPSSAASNSTSAAVEPVLETVAGTETAENHSISVSSASAIETEMEPGENAAISPIPDLVAETPAQPTPVIPETPPVAETSSPSADSLGITSPTLTPEFKPPASVPPIAAPIVQSPVPAPNSSGTTAAITFVAPAGNEVVNQPATTVILRFVGVSATGISAEVELRVNGQLVDAKSIGRTEVDPSTNLVTQVWYGVGLTEGENTLTAKVKGQADIATIKVVVRGAPISVELSPRETRIPADGRSIATLQGQLLDDTGNRTNRDAVVTLLSTAGEFVGADAEPDQPGFQVQARDGQFQAQLRAGLEPSVVQIRAVQEGLRLEGFTQIQFEPNLRPSLVTGVIDFRIGPRGTNFYSSFRDFLPEDRDNRTQVDLRGAVFATGRVGNWLFTGAYNSARSLNETCYGGTRLYRDYQACEPQYPVYGDTSSISVTAPSRDSLFLKFERSSSTPYASPDLFMWGDYNTEEFSTPSQQFTATSRQLHGFKANYNIGNLQITGLYANDLEGYQRDTIAPDGTSGFYFLSRRLLLPGSEIVALELEQLLRPGTVLDRVVLNRGLDYEIDYDRGTLLFREPVLRTDLDEDGNVLVRRIVTTYQYEDGGDNNSLYAGRIRYHLSRTPGQESSLGATYLREDLGARNFELYGADALISFGPNAQLIAEYARSRNSLETSDHVSGSAYRLEFTGRLATNVLARAYYRSTDPGFANLSTTSFVPGQTRYGAQITAKVTPTTDFRLQYDKERNFGVAPRALDLFEDILDPPTTLRTRERLDNSLTTIAAGIVQRIGRAKLEVDWIHRDRQDRSDEGLNSHSDQLRTRLQVPLTSRLTFQALNETTLSASTDAVFSDRTLVGLNWQVMPGISVRLAQQFFGRGPLAGNSITSLDTVGEYKLWPNTTLIGRYSIFNGLGYGMTGQGAIGIRHRWTIAPGLGLDFAYERVFGGFNRRTAAGPQYIEAYSVGQSGYSVGLRSGNNISIGLDYTDNPNFQASARYEYRTSSSGSNTVISAAANGKLTPALTILARYQQASGANVGFSGLGVTRSLRLGLAYRDPNNDKFNALLRYEYRRNPSIIPESLLLNGGTSAEDHTLAAEAIYAPNWRWEFYGKFALRNSRTNLARDLVGTSTISLTQWRATYRLNYRMDLVGEARWITQPSTGYSETGFSVEAGYYLTPNLRAAVGYSSGSVVAGDLVGSGSRSARGLYAGLTVKLNELFSGFGLQRPVPPQQQESQVKPVAQNPTPATLQAAAPLRLDVQQSLRFQTENNQVDPGSTPVLDHLATVLRQVRELNVEILAYLPTASYNAEENRTLASQTQAQRANAAREYLLSQGVAAQQVLVRALGDAPAGQTDWVSNSMGFVLTGANTTFGELASRLRQQGEQSPVLEILEGLVTPDNPTVALLPTHATAPAQSVRVTGGAIAPDSEALLKQVATTLKQDEQATIELQGYHSNPTGTAEDDALEQVIAIRNYLIDQGIDSDRIILRSPEPSTEPTIANRQVDLFLASDRSIPTATATTTPTILGRNLQTQELISALNTLLGQDMAAAEMVLKAMNIRPAQVQGVLIDPTTLQRN